MAIRSSLTVYLVCYVCTYVCGFESCVCVCVCVSLCVCVIQTSRLSGGAFPLTTYDVFVGRWLNSAHSVCACIPSIGALLCNSYRTLHHTPLLVIVFTEHVLHAYHSHGYMYVRTYVCPYVRTYVMCETQCKEHVCKSMKHIHVCQLRWTGLKELQCTCVICVCLNNCWCRFGAKCPQPGNKAKGNGGGGRPFTFWMSLVCVTPVYYSLAVWHVPVCLGYQTLWCV